MNSKGTQKFFSKVTGADASEGAVLAATLASFAHLGLGEETALKYLAAKTKRKNIFCRASYYS